MLGLKRAPYVIKTSTYLVFQEICEHFESLTLKLDAIYLKLYFQ